jgi:hypothetical protein
VTRASWKIFSILSLSTNLFLLLPSCGSTPSIPEWHGKIYTGDPASASLVRKQDPNDIIPANSDAFARIKAFTDSDFESFVRTYVYGCKQWFTDQLKPAEQVYKEVLGQAIPIPSGVPSPTPR